jgi:hypothetical protein
MSEAADDKLGGYLLTEPAGSHPLNGFEGEFRFLTF